VGLAVVVVLLVVFLFPSRFHGKVANSNVGATNGGAAQAEKIHRSPTVSRLDRRMHEETFADGITEELIDRFSKIPGFRVPGATSSFYFKGKKIPVADIARTLGWLTSWMEACARRARDCGWQRD